MKNRLRNHFRHQCEHGKVKVNDIEFIARASFAVLKRTKLRYFDRTFFFCPAALPWDLLRNSYYSSENTLAPPPSRPVVKLGRGPLHFASASLRRAIAKGCGPPPNIFKAHISKMKNPKISFLDRKWLWRFPLIGQKVATGTKTV